MRPRKRRRESGRKYNKFYDPENGFYYEQYWDDWNDYRDSSRDLSSDTTLFKPERVGSGHWYSKPLTDRNKKNLRLLKRRRLMRNHPRHNNE